MYQILQTLFSLYFTTISIIITLVYKFTNTTMLAIYAVEIILEYH